MVIVMVVVTITRKVNVAVVVGGRHHLHPYSEEVSLMLLVMLLLPNLGQVVCKTLLKDNCYVTKNLGAGIAQLVVLGLAAKVSRV